MKAATGELNLTLITIVALGAILALFANVLLPEIKDKLTEKWGETSDTEIDISYNEFNYEFVDYIDSELF